MLDVAQRVVERVAFCPGVVVLYHHCCPLGSWLQVKPLSDIDAISRATLLQALHLYSCNKVLLLNLTHSHPLWPGKSFLYIIFIPIKNRYGTIEQVCAIENVLYYLDPLYVCRTTLY